MNIYELNNMHVSVRSSYNILWQQARPKTQEAKQKELFLIHNSKQ